MEITKRVYKFYTLGLYGFIAGFFAALTFHQGSLWLLWKAAIAPFGPYKMTPTAPWGIPRLFSLALWGGVWGIIFGWIQDRFKGFKQYWIETFSFGAIIPSLVALLIVAPLKGHPVGGGWHWPLLATAFLINGMWGIGTGVFLNLLLDMSPSYRLTVPGCSRDMLCKR